MPHTFAINVRNIAQSERCLQSWVDCIHEFSIEKSHRSSAVLYEPGELHVRKLELSKLVNFTIAEARDMMRAKRRAVRVWEGPSVAKASL